MFLHSYIQWQQKYLQVHKKMFNEKNVHSFLIKKHLYFLEKAQSSKKLYMVITLREQLPKTIQAKKMN